MAGVAYSVGTYVPTYCVRPKYSKQNKISAKRREERIVVVVFVELSWVELRWCEMRWEKERSCCCLAALFFLFFFFSFFSFLSERRDERERLLRREAMRTPTVTPSCCWEKEKEKNKKKRKEKKRKNNSSNYDYCWSVGRSVASRGLAESRRRERIGGCSPVYNHTNTYNINIILSFSSSSSSCGNTSLKHHTTIQRQCSLLYIFIFIK